MTVIQMLIVPTQADRSIVHVTVAILATEHFVKVRNNFLFDGFTGNSIFCQGKSLHFVEVHI